MLWNRIGSWVGVRGHYTGRRLLNWSYRISGSKLANCSLGGSETGVIEGEGVFSLVGGGTLSASSESKEPEESAELYFEEEVVKLLIKEKTRVEAILRFRPSWLAGETGIMKVTTEGPFSSQKPAEKECAGKSIVGAGSCLISIECNGKKGEKGEVTTEPTKWFVMTKKADLECT